jgi:ribosome-binding protein aMBF1 (putative translation factor)
MHSASASAKQARLAALPDKPGKDEILLAFGKSLSSLRAAARLSQDKLARRCFLRHDDIAHFERGVPSWLEVYPEATNKVERTWPQS